MNPPFRVISLPPYIPYENLKASNSLYDCFQNFITNYQLMWATKNINIANTYFSDPVLVYDGSSYQPIPKSDIINRINAFFTTYSTLEYIPVDIKYCDDNVLTIFGVFNYGINSANFIQMFYFNSACKIYKFNDVTAYSSNPLP